LKVDKNRIRRTKICPEIGLKSSPKIVFSGTPGRGVLRFLAGAYSRPVHFLAFFVIFTKNVQI